MPSTTSILSFPQMVIGGAAWDIRDSLVNFALHTIHLDLIELNNVSYPPAYS